MQTPGLGRPRNEALGPARIARRPGRLVCIERCARGGERLIARESPKREQGKQDCGADSGHPRLLVEGRPRFAPGEDQQRNRTSQPGERDGWQLPVPVLSGVDQIRDVPTERRCRKRLLPSNQTAGDRKSEQRREQPEPYGPKLGKGLEVEAVGVENR